MTTQPEVLIDRARAAFDRCDYVAALADAREVVDNHPHFADVRHLMGVCLSLLAQPEAALDQFDRALAENDGYIEAHLSRAITLNELGRFDEAKEAVERAAAVERELGGRFESSVSARLANGHAAVADLYMAAGAPAEAVAEFHRALALRPGFHDIRNRLAEALMQMGELDAAAKELKETLDVHGRFFHARLNLGLVHYRAGRHDQARAEWEECHAQDPGSPQVRAYLHMLDQAK